MRACVPPCGPGLLHLQARTPETDFSFGIIHMTQVPSMFPPAIQDVHVLSSITVNQGKVYALFVKCPANVSV